MRFLNDLTAGSSPVTRTNLLNLGSRLNSGFRDFFFSQTCLCSLSCSLFVIFYAVSSRFATLVKAVLFVCCTACA